MKINLLVSPDAGSIVFILINPKAYPCDPTEVATIARDVVEASGVRIAVSPQAADIPHAADTGIGTWTQHADPNGHGSYTGSTLAEAVAETGAVGTLTNYSERRLKLADIDDSVQAAERAGLETYVCINSPAQIGAVSALGPDPVVAEPSELIGDDASVATVDPGIVTDAIDTAANVDEDVEIYCGVGIPTGDDVMTAGELDMLSILLASDVTKADGPRATLEDLISGL